MLYHKASHLFAFILYIPATWPALVIAAGSTLASDPTAHCSLTPLHEHVHLPTTMAGGYQAERPKAFSGCWHVPIVDRPLVSDHTRQAATGSAFTTLSYYIMCGNG